MGFLTPRQRLAVDAACARLIPGPCDDLDEEGHAGARDAHAGTYIDGLLSMFDSDPPRLYADRAIGPTGFARPTEPQVLGWRRRIAELRAEYTAGLSLLETLADGRPFDCLSIEEQDRILLSPSVQGFRALLFEHTVQGMYADPVYGGNYEGTTWDDLDIGIPGVRPVEDRILDGDAELDQVVGDNFEVLIGLVLDKDAGYG